MFGSLGWGLAMFFVGIALDHSTAFAEHPCGGPQRYEKNYTICFATFSVLMGAALLTAGQVRGGSGGGGGGAAASGSRCARCRQIRFKYEFAAAEEPAPAPASPTREERLQQQLAEQLQLPGLDTGARAAPAQPALAQAKVFAQTTREMPEWVTVLRQFRNVRAASFLFVAWFMGFGIGLIFTFLFWHLQVRAARGPARPGPRPALDAPSVFAGHRRHPDALRRRVGHQSHLRDLRLLLQLQADNPDGPLQGARASRVRATPPAVPAAAASTVPPPRRCCAWGWRATCCASCTSRG